MTLTAYKILDEAQGARERVRGMMLLRFVGIFFFLVAMLVPAHRDVFLNSQPQIYSLLVGLCLINCGYFLAFSRVRNVRAFAALQLSADLLAQTLIIWFSGGEESNFVFLYFTCILGASILLSGRGAVVFASCATILLATISALGFLARYNGWTLHLLAPTDSAHKAADLNVLFYVLIVRALGFYLVALLAGSLARRVTNISRLTREIVRNLDDGLLVLNSAGRIVFANRRSAELLGFDGAGCFNDKTAREMLRRETDEELRALLDCTTPTARPLEYVRHKDEHLSLEVTVRPLGAGGSRDLSRLVFLKDLTERKRMERAEKMAEHLQGIQEMAAAIAHEIRNPLASIKGSAQELGRLTLTAEEDRRLLGIVCRETDRLDRIIGDFMKFAGLRPPKMRRCDLSALLDDVADLLLARAPEKPFELKRNYPRGLFCVADAQQLMQVFLNIGLNAFDAIAPGGRIALEAESCCAQPARAAERRRQFTSEKIRVRIGDNGPGIPDGIMNKIFLPFFTTKEHGVGMGLAVVSRILQQHGIDLDVDTSPQTGATFIMTIDVSNLDNAEMRQKSASKVERNEPAALGRRPSAALYHV